MLAEARVFDLLIVYHFAFPGPRARDRCGFGAAIVEFTF